MKRLLLIISILIPFSAYAGGSVSRARINHIVSECRACEGSEVVHVGWLGTAAIRGIIRLSAMDDPDAREALTLLRGVRSLSVVDFEGCSESDKARLRSRINAALSNDEMLIEVADGQDKMRIYGVVNEKTESVRDFVLYTPGDCALICLFGTLPIDTVSKIAAND